jgi:nucleoside 2-deoxyribosyltransferase
LRGQGLNVFVPREHTIPNAWDLPNNIWGENVFAVDYLAITQCDVVAVLNFGMYSDSGTAWECGAAFALGKKVVNILCGCDDTEYSIMMVNGTNTTVDLDTFRKEWFANIVENIGKETNEKISQK